MGLEHTVGRGNWPFRDPANAGRCFIPLLLADCKLPDTLQHVALRRGLFSLGHPARRKRRAEFRPREMRSLRRVPVKLRLRLAGKTGVPTDRDRLRRRHGRLALGGVLIKRTRSSRREEPHFQVMNLDSSLRCVWRTVLPSVMPGIERNLMKHNTFDRLEGRLVRISA